jgi:hypothetical protein
MESQDVSYSRGEKKNWSFVSIIVVVPLADPIDLDLLELKEAKS